MSRTRIEPIDRGAVLEEARKILQTRALRTAEKFADSRSSEDGRLARYEKRNTPIREDIRQAQEYMGEHPLSVEQLEALSSELRAYERPARNVKRVPDSARRGLKTDGRATLVDIRTSLDMPDGGLWGKYYMT